MKLGKTIKNKINESVGKVFINPLYFSTGKLVNGSIWNSVSRSIYDSNIDSFRNLIHLK